MNKPIVLMDNKHPGKAALGVTTGRTRCGEPNGTFSPYDLQLISEYLKIDLSDMFLDWYVVKENATTDGLPARLYDIHIWIAQKPEWVMDPNHIIHNIYVCKNVFLLKREISKSLTNKK